jgi:hypothetical protein
VTVLVDDCPHRTGEHCASTAIRNLLSHQGTERCTYAELRNARNAPDYAMTCHNQYGDLVGRMELSRPRDVAIRTALQRNASAMVAPAGDLPAGIPAMRALAQDFESWSTAADWSWAARFGYQVVTRNTGASADHLDRVKKDFQRNLKSVGAELLDEYIRTHFIPVRRYGPSQVWLRRAGVPRP